MLLISKHVCFQNLQSSIFFTFHRQNHHKKSNIPQKLKSQQNVSTFPCVLSLSLYMFNCFPNFQRSVYIIVKRQNHRDEILAGASPTQGEGAEEGAAEGSAPDGADERQHQQRPRGAEDKPRKTAKHHATQKKRRPTKPKKAISLLLRYSTLIFFFLEEIWRIGALLSLKVSCQFYLFEIGRNIDCTDHEFSAVTLKIHGLDQRFSNFLTRRLPLEFQILHRPPNF